MNCSKCRRDAIPDVEYAGNRYCQNHFLELMEKRVRKNLRVRELIDVHKEYFLLDDGSSEAKITEYFLNKIFRGYLKLRIGKKPSEKKGKKELIIPTNLDEQSLIFLHSFLNNKKENKKYGAKTKNIMPLEVLLQKEVELLCNILKIKFSPRIKKDILEEIEKRHPGTKFSLFQSRMNILEK